MVTLKSLLTVISLMMSFVFAIAIQEGSCTQPQMIISASDSACQISSDTNTNPIDMLPQTFTVVSNTRINRSNSRNEHLCFVSTNSPVSFASEIVHLYYISILPLERNCAVFESDFISQPKYVTNISKFNLLI